MQKVLKGVRLLRIFFSGLQTTEKLFFFTARDETYIKAGINYRDVHVIGLGADYEPHKLTKSVFAFMFNFMYDIASLLPVATLKCEITRDCVCSLSCDDL